MASGSVINMTTNVFVGWKEGPDTRGSASLIWSCAITIFACTWSVLHLNVPGLRDTPFQILLRKIKWMFINILFPEFVFSKAVCDLRLALKELQEFGDSTNQGEIDNIKWTMVHRGLYGHQWCWEVGFPQWTNQLYRLLFLEPPGSPFKEICWCLPFHARHPRWTRWLHVLLFLKPPQSQHEYQRLGSFINTEERPQFYGSRETGENGSINDLGENAAKRIAAEHAPEGDQHRSSRSQETAETVPIYRRTVQTWTVVHSYHAQMGGLLYLNDESPRDTMDCPPDYYCLTAAKLTPRCCWQPTRHPLKHLVLDEKDIYDKSKADWFLKSIAMVQITWLSLSISFRGIAGLPITQLEIATIAFAVTAVFAYIANWWKPKDVSRPTILQPMGWCSVRRLGAERTQSFIHLLWSPADAAKRSRVVCDTERVKNDLVWVESDQRSIFVLAALSSLAFGGLHCLAWNFEFPTRIELICWRVASLTSAILPLIILTMSLIFTYLSTNYVDSRILSAWVSKLEPLEKLRPQWLKLMICPEFCAWEPKARVTLMSSPAGSRNWEQQQGQSLEEIEGLNDKELRVLGDYDSLRFWLARFRIEGKTTRNLQKRRDDDEQQIALVHQNISVAAKGLKDQLACCNDQAEALELWRDYEAFVTKKLKSDTTCLANKTLIEYIVSAYDEVSKLEIKMGVLQEQCRRAASVLSVCGAILYTIARLTIIALLFTCLRAAPEGIYQITPWFEYLPKIS